MGCCVDMVWLRSALLALLVVSEAVDPIAPHVLVVVPPGQDAVVRLTGHDLDGDKLKAHVASVPASGAKSRSGSSVVTTVAYVAIRNSGGA